MVTARLYKISLDNFKGAQNQNIILDKKCKDMRRFDTIFGSFVSLTLS